MEVTDRVHIVAHGWELARVVDPLYKLKADKVVVIVPQHESFLADFEQEMLDDLRSMKRLELDTREANLYDLDSALQVFTQAVKDHEGDEVYINVSTGTSIAAIAGMVAAQTTGATPYHVTPSLGEDGEDLEHLEDVPGALAPDEPVIQTVGPMRELPVFELDGPSSEQLQILGYLYAEDGATKKELIRYAEDEQLPFIVNTEAQSDEGRYRLLESHIIDPLTEGEYVRVEKIGRKKHVYIEERGIDALAAFPLESDVLETMQDDTFDDPVSLAGSAPVDRMETDSYKSKGDDILDS